jgi:hypothetical protein
VATVVKLTSEECGGLATAYARHNSNWFAMRPITNPALAFKNLLLQIEGDYGRIVPSALIMDPFHYYRAMIDDMVLPKLREVGLSDIDAWAINDPCFIYGQFRVQASCGVQLEVKYGSKDADGFKWYGVTGDLGFGCSLGIELGVLTADSRSDSAALAFQLRITISHVRLSIVLSKVPLSLCSVVGQERQTSTLHAVKLVRQDAEAA